jgi:ATP-dependent RNA helicase DeaD
MKIYPVITGRRMDLMQHHDFTLFTQLGIDDRLLRALNDLNFEEPSAIQAQAIPVALRGRDLIGQAQTGTGKTAAFAIPVIQNTMNTKHRPRGPQALIVTPTRELTIQITEEFHRLAKHTSCRALSIFGGQPIGRQIRELKQGVDVVVGTPGRLLDHLSRRTLILDNLQTVILDEADEMMAMGFIDDIERILRMTPSTRQTLLFSATMPTAIKRLAITYMRSPVHIAIRPEHVVAPDIEQIYFEVTPHARFEALNRIIDSETIQQVIIFCRTRRGTDQLADRLRDRGHAVDALHGDLEQRQRDRVMFSFRQGDIDLLVATDVAARGLDVQSITHVINYDIPTDPESYVHRIGRTGRAGRSGIAMTMIHPKERRTLAQIERLTGVRMQRRGVPTPAMVVAKQQEACRERLVKVLETDNLATYRRIVEQLQGEYDHADVAAAALKLLLARDAEAPGTGMRAG